MSEAAAERLRARFADGMSHATAVDVVTTDGPPPRCWRPPSPEFGSEYPPMQAVPG